MIMAVESTPAPQAASVGSRPREMPAASNAEDIVVSPERGQAASGTRAGLTPALPMVTVSTVPSGTCQAISSASRSLMTLVIAY
jgi:hypothetical protein